MKRKAQCLKESSPTASSSDIVLFNEQTLEKKVRQYILKSQLLNYCKFINTSF